MSGIALGLGGGMDREPARLTGVPAEEYGLHS